MPNAPRSTALIPPGSRPGKNSDENLALAAAIDCIWTDHPAFGSRKITQMLRRQGGVPANRKRVRRLMKLMGIASLAPGPRTTKANPAHIKYPYLLRDVVVDHPNQAWATDIERHEALLNREGVQDPLHQLVAAGW